MAKKCCILAFFCCSKVGHFPISKSGRILGKFGVETDRMDKSAVGHDYQANLVKHASQKDYATGFGGKYGVQSDRIDKVNNIPLTQDLKTFDF